MKGIIHKRIEKSLVFRSPVRIILDKSRSCKFEGKLYVVLVGIISSHVSRHLAKRCTFTYLLLGKSCKSDTDILLIPSKLAGLKDKLEISCCVKSGVTGIYLHPKFIQGRIDVEPRFSCAGRQNNRFLLTRHEKACQKHHQYIIHYSLHNLLKH